MDREIIKCEEYNDWSEGIVVCRGESGKKIIARSWFDTKSSHELKSTLHVKDQFGMIVCTTGHLATAKKVYNSLR